MAKKTMYFVESILVLLISLFRIGITFLRSDSIISYCSSLFSYENIKVSVGGICFIAILLGLIIVLTQKAKKNISVLHFYLAPVILLYTLTFRSDSVFSGPLFDFFLPLSGIMTAAILIIYLSGQLKKENYEHPAIALPLIMDAMKSENAAHWINKKTGQIETKDSISHNLICRNTDELTKNEDYFRIPVIDRENLKKEYLNHVACPAIADALTNALVQSESDSFSEAFRSLCREYRQLEQVYRLYEAEKVMDAAERFCNLHELEYSLPETPLNSSIHTSEIVSIVFWNEAKEENEEYYLSDPLYNTLIPYIRNEKQETPVAIASSANPLLPWATVWVHDVVSEIPCSQQIAGLFPAQTGQIGYSAKPQPADVMPLPSEWSDRAFLTENAIQMI